MTAVKIGFCSLFFIILIFFLYLIAFGKKTDEGFGFLLKVLRYGFCEQFCVHCAAENGCQR